MADFTEMRRPPEDFLINPTFAAKERTRSPMAANHASVMRPVEMFSFQPNQKTPEPATAIRKFRDEPLFWQGYASEEEAASPIADDDLSIHSASNELQHTSRRSSPFPEQLAHTCKRVERQCGKAQAVTVLPAGKARIVNVPKMVDVSAPPRVRRPLVKSMHPSLSSPTQVGSPTSSQGTRNNSPRTSGERSPISTAPSSVVELPKNTKVLRHRPSLPALAAAARAQPATPQMRPSPQHAPDFLNHDPYPTSVVEPPKTPQSPSRRKLHKFSSSLGLNMFNKASKQTDSPDSSIGAELETVKEPEPVMYSARHSQPSTPARTQERRSRMIPRGANERAPVLVLPECPESYDDSLSFPSWPTRRDSEATYVTMDRSTKMPKLHTRRRSVSAAMVTAEA
ncbi:hypothetical protein D0866_10373 [Hortaea werneckii]|uniref:Uncharacterized protein n=1 Tax=Hortaea werneckii TaxID=91943 RepID=A0A3M7AI34_HORWE|nr:hypothetical protein D0866_10373 [Hortaea werneckii]